MNKCPQVKLKDAIVWQIQEGTFFQGMVMQKALVLERKLEKWQFFWKFHDKDRNTSNIIKIIFNDRSFMEVDVNFLTTRRRWKVPV